MSAEIPKNMDVPDCAWQHKAGKLTVRAICRKTNSIKEKKEKTMTIKQPRVTEGNRRRTHNHVERVTCSEMVTCSEIVKGGPDVPSMYR